MKILITGTVVPQKLIGELEPEYEVIRAERVDGERLPALVSDVDGYLLGGEEKATPQAVDAAKRLKVIAFAGVQPETFFLGDALGRATQRGIPVTTTPGANLEAVAEMAAAMICERARRLSFLDEAVRSRRWEQFQGRELKAKTLGIVGFGRIGQRVAEIMHKGLGMEIIAYEPYQNPAMVEFMKSLGGTFTNLAMLLRRADVISLHAVLTEETRWMIGGIEFGLMKTGAILVNTARADLVQPSSLRAALGAGRIVAAFDGYYQEPIQEDRWDLLKFSPERFLVTPHQAFNTAESNEATARMAIRAIREVLSGRDYQFVANPEYKHYLPPGTR